MAARRLNLTFHGTGEPPRPLDEGEASVWVSRGQLEEVLAAVAQRRDVTITFDDGNASDVDVALPLLVEHGLSATFFVVAGRLDEPTYLRRVDLASLRDAGMTIGSHGMRHVSWRGLSSADFDRELSDARSILEEVVERPVTEAACPFGAYDRRACRELRARGYERVYTSDGGRASPDEWLQARTTITRDGPRIDEILATETRRERSLRGAKRLVKRWR